MHKIEYLPLAQADIVNAVDHLAFTLEAPQAAAALLDELDHVVEQISHFPYAFELYRTDRPLRDEIRKAPIKSIVNQGDFLSNSIVILRVNITLDCIQRGSSGNSVRLKIPDSLLYIAHRS